jgi:predicted transposase/invertase (TIGR01784 family)
MEIGTKQGIEIGTKQGMEIGTKQGMEIGTKQGIEIGKIEIAKNMLNKRLTVDLIREITGLDEDTIKSLSLS